MSRKLDTEQLRRLKKGTSKAMRRLAEHRKCKACGRGNGYGKPFMVDGFWYQRCRYCGHERGATELS